MLLYLYNKKLSMTVYTTISNMKMDRVSHRGQFRILCKDTVTQKQNFKLWMEFPFANI